MESLTHYDARNARCVTFSTTRPEQWAAVFSSWDWPAIYGSLYNVGPGKDTRIVDRFELTRADLTQTLKLTIYNPKKDSACNTVLIQGTLFENFVSDFASILF